jgi:hypothetical protein
MNTTPDHPDFTALALGEHIHGTPARAVLDALRTSVAARQEAEQLRDTAAQLSFVLKGQPPQRLDSKRRNAIYNADIAALRERFAAEERDDEEEIETFRRPVVRRPRRPTWIYPSVAAAAVVAAAVIVLQVLPGRGRSVAPSGPLTDAGADPPGRILVSTTPPASQRPRGPGLPAVPPAVFPQEHTAPPPQEAMRPSPMVPAPEVAREQPDLPLTPSPEIPRTKPPFRNDFRDYASPPRVKHQ